MANLTIPELPEELFYRADYHTSHSDHTDANRREYNSAVQALIDCRHVTQGEIDKFSQLWSAWLSARSDCVSMLVAGRAKFNTKQAQRRSSSADSRWKEIMAYRERLDKLVKRRAKQKVIDDAGGVEAHTRKKMETLKATHAMMKAANVIAKRRAPKNQPTEEKLSDLRELGIKDPEKLFVPDWGGSIGFPTYQLTGLKRDIAALQKKLDAMQADAKDDEEFTFEGFTVAFAYDDDRMRIEFLSKPSVEVRNKLKSNGFKWAPSANAWQRKLTADGEVSWSALNALHKALGVRIET